MSEHEVELTSEGFQWLGEVLSAEDFDGCICGYAHDTHTPEDNERLKAGCDLYRQHAAARLADAEARAEAADAEAANTEADYERRGERLWRLAAKAGWTPLPGDNDATAELCIEIALNKVARVEALADQADANRASHFDIDDCGCSYKDCYECGKWCRCTHTPWASIREALRGDQ